MGERFRIASVPIAARHACNENPLWGVPHALL
jgi:hypothetical protein